MKSTEIRMNILPEEESGTILKLVWFLLHNQSCLQLKLDEHDEEDDFPKKKPQNGSKLDWKTMIMSMWLSYYDYKSHEIKFKSKIQNLDRKIIQ